MNFMKKNPIPSLLPKGKFGYNAPRNILITPCQYFNQILLNFNEHFASDADYIFFARSVYQQNHLRSRINFCLNKNTSGALTAGTVKNNFKEKIERFASDNESSLLSSVKGTPPYSKQFLYDKLATIKHLVIHTYFLTLSCADLR